MTGGNFVPARRVVCEESSPGTQRAEAEGLERMVKRPLCADSGRRGTGARFSVERSRREARTQTKRRREFARKPVTLDARGCRGGQSKTLKGS